MRRRRGAVSSPGSQVASQSQRGAAAAQPSRITQVRSLRTAAPPRRPPATAVRRLRLPRPTVDRRTTTTISMKAPISRAAEQQLAQAQAPRRRQQGPRSPSRSGLSGSRYRLASRTTAVGWERRERGTRHSTSVGPSSPGGTRDGRNNAGSRGRNTNPRPRGGRRFDAKRGTLVFQGPFFTRSWRGTPTV